MKETLVDFLTIGELLVDFSQTGTGMHGYPQYEALPGGAVANVVAALAKWKLRVGFIGNVGDDALGSMLAATLRNAGVDCTRLRPSRDPTSLAMVNLASDGERSFAFYWKDTSCAALADELADPKNCTGAQVFHFGSVSLSTEQSRRTTLAAVRVAKESGSIISFDANLRPGLWSWRTDLARVPILESIKLSNIVKLSEEELYFLFDIEAAAGSIHRDDERVGELMARLVAETGISVLFVTFGREGCRWLGAAGEGCLDGLKVKAIDTTGAGDCFMAGILYQFLGIGKRPEKLDAGDYRAMARRGITSGSLSTQKRGGIPSIPSLEEVAAGMPA